MSLSVFSYVLACQKENRPLRRDLRGRGHPLGRREERRPSWTVLVMRRRPPLTLLPSSSNRSPLLIRGWTKCLSCSRPTSRGAVVISLNQTTSRQHQPNPSTSLLQQLPSQTTSHRHQHRPPTCPRHQHRFRQLKAVPDTYNTGPLQWDTTNLQILIEISGSITNPANIQTPPHQNQPFRSFQSVCFDYVGKCTRPICRYKHICSFCGKRNHTRKKCYAANGNKNSRAPNASKPS